MPANSLDIYLRQLVLEAIRLEASKIRVRDDGDKTHIDFVVTGEDVPYPHAPHCRYGRLMPHLRERAGVLEPSEGKEVAGGFRVPWRDGELPLDATFYNSGSEQTALIDLQHVAAIRPVA